MLMKYNVMILYILGMYTLKPDASIVLKFFLYFWRFICSFGLGILCIQSLLDVYLREKFIFVEVSANLLNSGVFMGALYRIFYFYVFDYKAENLIKEMNKVFRMETSTGLEEINLNKEENFARRFTIFWTIVVFITGEFTALLPLCFIPKIGKTIPIPAWYPYDWKEPYYYVGTMFTQAVIQSFMGFSYGNADIFYVVSVYLTSGQFKLLNWEFQNILYTALLKFGIEKEKVVAFSKSFNEGEKGMEDDVVVNKKLVREGREYGEILDVIKSEEFGVFLEGILEELIRKHQKVLMFAKMLDEFLSPLLLPCLTFSLFYIIFISFSMVVTTNTSSFMGLIEYLCTAMTQVYMFSFFGQLLIDQSLKLGNSLYKSPWYLCNRNFLKNFKFLQFVVSKRIMIRAGNYFVMSMDLFVAICKTSASYFAFLRQITAPQEEI